MELPKKKSNKVTDLRKFIFQIYGEPKSGKTTFASNFDNAVFIMTEPGAKFQSVFGGDHVHIDWQDIKDTIKRLITEEHDFQTVVIDTVDNAFDLCSKHTCKTRGIEHESDEGYGKGWTAVKTEFRSAINALANRGFGIVFISHTKQSERESHGIKHPFLDNSLSNSAKSYVNGLCDFIFYAFIDDDNKRLLRTKSNMNINAGDRSGTLPEVIPMDYKYLEKQLTTNKKESSK